MAIKPIDSLPGEQVDQYNEARNALTEDVTQIIKDNVSLCEITSEKYTTNTMRDAIKRAIRYATVYWNRREDVQSGDAQRVSEDMFSILRRKDNDGNYHFYIKFSMIEEER